MKPLIGPAVIKDIPVLAEIVLKASRGNGSIGVFDVVFPEDTSETAKLKALRKILSTSRRSWCHWKNFLVARDGDTVIAGVSGHRTYSENFLTVPEGMRVGLASLQLDLTQINQALSRLAQLVEIAIPDEPNSWSGEWLATLDQERSRVAFDLCYAQIALGRKAGCISSQADVFIDNPAVAYAQAIAPFIVTQVAFSDKLQALTGHPGIARIRLEN